MDLSVFTEQLTWQKTRSNLRILFALLFLSACGTTQEEDPFKDAYPKPPYEVFFNSDFQDVWRAAQISIAQYAIRVNDIDSGILETDSIKLDRGWQSPHKPPTPPGGRNYSIEVRIARGYSKNSRRPKIRVRVTKNLRVRRDFFSKVKELRTDGLEEMSILYRIGRELEIEDGLRRYQKRVDKN